MTESAIKDTFVKKKGPGFRTILAGLLCLLWLSDVTAAALVFQSDFGVKDAAVASMKGVAFGVSSEIPLYDITHEIPPYNIWEAALRLEQTAAYWPVGTVFVSVVDPGVGTDRKSVVMRSFSGHYFVTPDNGTLTFVAESLGVEQVREIDEAVNRRQDSQASYTFHGRDVYAYTGARLAAGIISFEEVGRDLGRDVHRIEFQKAVAADGGILGNVPILDIQFGNVWTNIPGELLEKSGIAYGSQVLVELRHNDTQVLATELPFHRTFGEVPEGKPLMYLNSLGQVSFAVNLGNFADIYGIGSGSGWHVRLQPVKVTPDS